MGGDHVGDAADAAPAAQPARSRSGPPLADHHLPRLGCPDLAPDAEVLVCELATNAVLHAGTDSVVEADYEDRVLVVSVSDEQPGDFTFDSPTIDAERGRGLCIVDGLANAWGVVPTTTGKLVWFALWPPNPTQHPSQGRAVERLAGAGGSAQC